MAAGGAEPPGRRRFPASRRVRAARDFGRAYRAGSRARGASMTVVVVPNGLEHSRLGLSVGKRCWKSAVRRNRVRRVFREAFRLAAAELPRGVDVVMIASTPGLAPALEPTRRELVRLARKALGRYREKQGSAAPEGPSGEGA